MDIFVLSISFKDLKPYHFIHEKCSSQQDLQNSFVFVTTKYTT